MARQAPSGLPLSAPVRAVASVKRGQSVKVAPPTRKASESNTVERAAFDAMSDALISEDALRQQIRTAASGYGFDLAYHTHRSDRSDFGWPDDIYMHRSRWFMFAIEAKRQDGRLSLMQVVWLDAMATYRDNAAAPFYVYVARPSDRDALWIAMGKGVDAPGALHQWCTGYGCKRCQTDRKRATLSGRAVRPQRRKRNDIP